MTINRTVIMILTSPCGIECLEMAETEEEMVVIEMPCFDIIL